MDSATLEPEFKMNIFNQRLSIDVSGVCNLACLGCKSQPETVPFMSVENFEKILKKVETADQLFLHWFHEPTLHPELPELIAIAKRDFGYQNIYVCTNGTTKNLSNPDYVWRMLDNLDRFTFCVDGWDQETLQKYRVGANWNQLLKNLKCIKEFNCGATKEMRVLMFPYNEEYESWFKLLATAYNFNSISFASPHILGKTVLTQDEMVEWLPSTPKYRRYYYHKNAWRHKDKTKCVVGPPVIATNGDVLACQWDTTHRFVLGNIYTDTMKYITTNYNHIVESMCNKDLIICKDCLCNTTQRTDFKILINENI